MFRIFLTIIFLVGLIYLLSPGPTRISDFPPLPNSVKSGLDGDTVQNPNIAAYFADFRREFITKYYFDIFKGMSWFGSFITPVKINHPPEYAYRYIRDQQESTFLEEYIYPLRGSIFVNGYDPLIDNTMHNAIMSFEATHIPYKEIYYESKTTLRFYPSNPFLRVVVYLGIWAAVLFLFKLWKKAWREQ